MDKKYPANSDYGNFVKVHRVKNSIQFSCANTKKARNIEQSVSLKLTPSFTNVGRPCC